MARQHRLVIPGLAHLVVLPALAGVHPFPAAADRERFLAVMHESAAGQSLQIHAHALLPQEFRALVTPGDEAALSHWVQALGRRYVSAYNKRHGRAGTLWSGRFRCAAVEPGAWTLLALRYIDAAAPAIDSAGADVSSAGLRLGGARERPLVDPAEYWALGNTPFERETAYAALLAEPLPPAAVARLERCLSGGWVCGEPGFVQRLASGAKSPRRLAPGTRGRPPSRR